MAPRPDLILENVLRNVSAGTYGVVEVVKKNTTIPPSILADNQIENDTLVECNVALDGNITSQVGSKTTTNLEEIPAKEIIIVFLMLGLWLYSILLTRKAWVKILRE